MICLSFRIFFRIRLRNIPAVRGMTLNTFSSADIVTTQDTGQETLTFNSDCYQTWQRLDIMNTSAVTSNILSKENV